MRAFRLLLYFAGAPNIGETVIQYDTTAATIEEAQEKARNFYGDFDRVIEWMPFFHNSTPRQMGTHYLRNSEELRRCQERAKHIGGKYQRRTAEEWGALADEYEFNAMMYDRLHLIKRVKK